jgi:hypothetical protein
MPSFRTKLPKLDTPSRRTELIDTGNVILSPQCVRIDVAQMKRQRETIERDGLGLHVRRGGRVRSPRKEQRFQTVVLSPHRHGDADG